MCKTKNKKLKKKKQTIPYNSNLSNVLLTFKTDSWKKLLSEVQELLHFDFDYRFFS